jgi:Fic family protein
MGPEFLRAIESHRVRTLARRRPGPEAISRRLLASWIYHDNMVEGRLFSPTEVLQALDQEDDALDRYLHPLMQEIRRYGDAVRFVWAQAHQGPEAFSVENMKAIHRMLTPNAEDRSGQYRETSPVHRDYYQRICTADKVPYHLRRIFEQVRAEYEDALDPVAFAADIHHKLMFVYPFRRNPGTTARLFTNLLLLSRGYPPVIVTAGLRSEYYEALCSEDSDDLATLFRQTVSGFLREVSTEPPYAAQVGLS